MDTCGCRYEPIIDPMGHCVGGNIIYCLLHAAAPELRQMLERLLEKTDCNDWNHREVYGGKNLIARIDGKEEPYPEVEKGEN